MNKEKRFKVLSSTLLCIFLGLMVTGSFLFVSSLNVKDVNVTLQEGERDFYFDNSDFSEQDFKGIMIFKEGVLGRFALVDELEGVKEFAQEVTYSQYDGFKVSPMILGENGENSFVLFEEDEFVAFGYDGFDITDLQFRFAERTAMLEEGEVGKLNFKLLGAEGDPHNDANWSGMHTITVYAEGYGHEEDESYDDEEYGEEDGDVGDSEDESSEDEEYGEQDGDVGDSEDELYDDQEYGEQEEGDTAEQLGNEEESEKDALEEIDKILEEYGLDDYIESVVDEELFDENGQVDDDTMKEHVEEIIEEIINNIENIDESEEPVDLAIDVTEVLQEYMDEDLTKELLGEAMETKNKLKVEGQIEDDALVAEVSEGDVAQKIVNVVEDTKKINNALDEMGSDISVESVLVIEVESDIENDLKNKITVIIEESAIEKAKEEGVDKIKVVSQIGEVTIDLNDLDGYEGDLKVTIGYVEEEYFVGDNFNDKTYFVEVEIGGEKKENFDNGLEISLPHEFEEYENDQAYVYVEDEEFRKIVEADLSKKNQNVSFETKKVVQSVTFTSYLKQTSQIQSNNESVALVDKKVLGRIIQSDAEYLEVKMDIADVRISRVDLERLEEDVEIRVRRLEKEDVEKYPKNAIKLIEVKIFSAGMDIREFSEDLFILVHYEKSPDEDTNVFTVFHLDENGESENVIGVYQEDTGTVNFRTKHLSMFFIAPNRVNFNDNNQEWATRFINSMSAKGIIKGYGEGSFKPENNVTRAEFVTMMVNALKLPISEYRGTFKDVNQTDWFAGMIETGYEHGLVSGFGDGIFAPRERITREQMTAIVTNVMERFVGKEIIEDNGLLKNIFDDYDQISDYAHVPVATAYHYDVVRGRGDGFFPQEMSMRSEASVVIYKIVNMMHQS